MSAPLAVGLVGAGAIAQSYAQSFGRCRQARLAGVADVREEAARALAEAYGCPGFGSHAALPAMECAIAAAERLILRLATRRGR